MGMSRIEITVTGNHGCDRNAKEGEKLGPLCDVANCVDCRAREFVAKLQGSGNSLDASYELFGDDGKGYRHGATLTHWPHQADGGIVDDLVEGVRRKGHF